MRLPATHPAVPELFKLAKEKLELPSYYALAKKLKVSPSRIGNYTSGRATPDEEMCVKLAKILDWPESYILALAQLERAHQPRSRTILRENLGEIYDMLKTFGGATVGALVAVHFALALLPSGFETIPTVSAAEPVTDYTTWMAIILALAGVAAALRLKSSPWYHPAP